MNPNIDKIIRFLEKLKAIAYEEYSNNDHTLAILTKAKVLLEAIKRASVNEIKYVDSEIKYQVSRQIKGLY